MSRTFGIGFRIGKSRAISCIAVVTRILGNFGIVPLVLLTGFATELQSRAESNFNPSDSVSWGANIGWLNWRSNGDLGAEINPFVCAGFVYSANVGWIHLGNGAPANGTAYQNNSATNFGVNVDAQGNLRGLAYAANIGWINFEAIGQPRFDFQSGRLSGHIYSANAGWIALSDSTYTLQLDFLPAGGDSDADGIPDAWEMNAAGNLTMLGAGNDADSDGITDVEEYQADTNPLNPSDQLRILQLNLSSGGSAVNLTWTTRPTRLYTVQARLSCNASDAWVDSGLGLLVADGTTLSRTIPSSSEQRYFRIQAVRPLSR